MLPSKKCPYILEVHRIHSRLFRKQPKTVAINQWVKLFGSSHAACLISAMCHLHYCTPHKVLLVILLSCSLNIWKGEKVSVLSVSTGKARSKEFTAWVTHSSPLTQKRVVTYTYLCRDWSVVGGAEVAMAIL